MGREKLLEVTGYIIRSDRVTSLEPSTRSAVFVGFCHNFYGDEEKTCHWRKKKMHREGWLAKPRASRAEQATLGEPVGQGRTHCT